MVTPDYDRQLAEAEARLTGPPTLSLTHLSAEGHLNISQATLDRLAAHDIHLLADIRARGGIGDLADLQDEDREAVSLLEAQAALECVSADPQINAVLIDKGYQRPSDVTHTTRSQFVRSMRREIGDFKAAQIYHMSRVQESFLSSIMMGLRTGATTGSKAESAEADRGIIASLRDQCTCDNCESAVSPLAYLAELLEYVTTYVKNRHNGAAVNLRFLTKYLHQPFHDLPASCDVIEEEIRQVRICVEVLRRYLKENPPSDPQKKKLAKAEDQYLRNAYLTLLEKLGTSYEELRLARTASEEDRKALADRLGIDLVLSDFDFLEKLTHDIESLSEEGMELFYGLRDTKRDPLSNTPTPYLLNWRQEHLRTLWKEQDWPTDLPPDDQPRIDPDIIGPDDFRNPAAKQNSHQPDKPYDLWLARRAWVDEQLHEIASKVKDEVREPDFSEMLRVMRQPVCYKDVEIPGWSINQPRTLMATRNELTGGNASVIEEAQTRVEKDLRLTVESFMRLMELYEKDVAARDTRNEKVQDSEWQEVCSILVQSRKAALFVHWHHEEEDLGIKFGPGAFWLSLREPVEGDWPNIPVPYLPRLTRAVPGKPFIDPEEVDLIDLPDSSVGVPASRLWHKRQQELVDLRDDLETRHHRYGFEHVLRFAIGDPNPGDDVPDLDQYYNDLNSSERTVENVRKTIELQLCMSEEDFCRLWVIVSKESETELKKKPTQVEYDEIYNILTSAHKRKHLYRGWPQYQGWIKQERDLELTYYTALKAKLPQWRAPATSRQEWQQALRIRRSRPLIDPDLIGPIDLKSPKQEDPAYYLWDKRRKWITAQLVRLQKACKPPNDTLYNLDSIIEDTLGVPAINLVALEEAYQQGEAIEPRLDQLDLEIDAFFRLMEIRMLLEGSSSLLASEWDEVSAILTQVLKRKEFTQWREEEKQRGLTLSQDYFQLPPPDPLTFPPPPLSELPVWLAKRSDRLDWQDTLQARIDREINTEAALEEAVGSTEESVLPTLRDALIMAYTDAHMRFDERAELVSDQLFIDAKMSGSQITTRVSQAIETIQTYLYALRMRLAEAPHDNYGIDDDSFDERWKWLGSYATWRAAMFVSMYPENLLLPNLRKRQTPAFRKLVSDLRGNRRLTPEQAYQAVEEYSGYFRDVCNLTLEASCQTRTLVRDGDGRSRTGVMECELFYVFARGGETNTAYWSAYNPQAKVDASQTPGVYAQTPWEAIPGLQNLVNIIGTVPYEVSPEERFMFLFARTQEDEKQKLVFTKYNLNRQAWTGQVDELELPDNRNGKQITRFSAVIRQTFREDSPPQLAIRCEEGTIYNRSLNREGKDWIDLEGDWLPLVNAPIGNRYVDLLAMVEISDEEFYVFAHKGAGDVIEYRLFGPHDDGRWVSVGSANFHGVYRAPSTSEVFVQSGDNWYSGGTQHLTGWNSLRRSDQDLSKASWSSIEEFDIWLNLVTGVSLKKVFISDDSPYEGISLFEFFEGPFQESDYTEETIETLVRAALKMLWDASELDRKLMMVPYIFNVRAGIQTGSTTLRLEIGDWKDWAFADEMVQLFTVDGLEIYEVLIVIGNNERSVDYKYRANQEERQVISNDVFSYRIVPTSGKVSVDSTRYFACQNYEMGHYNLFPGTILSFTPRLVESDNMINQVLRDAEWYLAPIDAKQLSAIAFPSAEPLRSQRALIEAAFLANADGPASNRAYLDEAYYFVPMHIALQLQARGHYIAALDWFRSVYDYSARRENRKIAPILAVEAQDNATNTFERLPDWLLDPLNPHGVAATRPNAYTCFTLLSIIRCFLDYADAEFTHDTAESVSLARLLYDATLDLLDTPVLQQHTNQCDDTIAELVSRLEPYIVDRSWLPVFLQVMSEIAAVPELSKLYQFKTQLLTIMEINAPLSERLSKIRELINEARESVARPSMSDIISERRLTTALAHQELLSEPEIALAAQSQAVIAGQDFQVRMALATGLDATTLEQESIPWLRQQTWKVNGGFSYGIGESLLTAPSLRFCVPQNPILEALRLRAELNLYKLRNCRNIAGVERQLEPYAVPTDTTSGMPTIGAGGQLVLPGLSVLQPTPYRYAVLIERAKQLVGHAQQLESMMLSTLEKRDVEYYNLLKARQDLQLARAGVRLQDLRVREAEHNVSLAEMQQERSQILAEHYSDLLSAGLRGSENDQLNALGVAISIQTTLAAAYATASALSYAAMQYGAAAQYALQSLSTTIGVSSTLASFYGVLASFERRVEEWQFQRRLAQHDVRIGAQQIRIAEDHVRIIGQERLISELQSDHAGAVVDFLANKFTNAELYDWMSNILEGAYSYFLQQATTMAQLAANQLAFERQEVPPPFIQHDYWESPADAVSGTVLDTESVDRRGMTGSARLLQAIYQLDQYAFETNERKLQLTKTISLASLAPVEFQKFRETGVITFATPMKLFDWDFPGHYLRLIHQVRTSVIALVPPIHGIKATLTSSRLSHVVVGGDIFQTTIIQRGPDQAALSSPRDASGLFELNAQSDMLRPFEGIGVDTTWEFRMPKAANLFDYRMIADVLITIDYTALNSFDYQQQVLQTLDANVSGDRPYSLRHHLADQWYDLHNPDRTSTPMTIRFEVKLDDFPPNLERLKIQHIALYFARSNGQLFEIDVTHLHFTENGVGGRVGGGARTVDGIISTRRGNASSWTAMQGRSPSGNWELALPDREEIRRLFRDELIEDILFVITYKGRAHAWPS